MPADPDDKTAITSPTKATHCANLSGVEDGALGAEPSGSQTGETLPKLASVMQRLLADDGCPWDRSQTLETLRPYVIEEAHEVVDAIDRNDSTLLREELGDLLLQVVFQKCLV